jgi:hypothetical protein
MGQFTRFRVSVTAPEQLTYVDGLTAFVEEFID